MTQDNIFDQSEIIHIADPQLIEQRLLDQLKYHFAGWLTKIESDFSEFGFEQELSNLTSDPLYTSFHLASSEYALVRVMGRISISIGRRLGQIFDSMPKYVTQTRFGLDAAVVSPKLQDKLNLDVCIPLEDLTLSDRAHVLKVCEDKQLKLDESSGLGIEIRYNFNPNDSSRLRKDVEMANILLDINLTPVYLIYSSISPRDEAIARLRRAGWTFFIGQDATDFTNALIGMDLGNILNRDGIREEVAKEMDIVMTKLYSSYGFNKLANLRKP